MTDALSHNAAPYAADTRARVAQQSLVFDAPRYAPLQPMQRDILQLLYAGWTTPLEALNRANCLSLSQRVGELIRAGYHVEKKTVALPRGKHCKAYRIEAT